MRLYEAIAHLGVQGELSASGRWLRLQGAHCDVFVVEAPGSHYFVWCDHPAERSVQRFRDPIDAIVNGLGRAAHPAVPPATNRETTNRTTNEP